MLDLHKKVVDKYRWSINFYCCIKISEDFESPLSWPPCVFVNHHCTLVHQLLFQRIHCNWCPSRPNKSTLHTGTTSSSGKSNMSFSDKYKLYNIQAANIESTNKHMSDTWNLSNIYRSELICQPGLPMVPNGINVNVAWYRWNYPGRTQYNALILNIIHNIFNLHGTRDCHIYDNYFYQWEPWPQSLFIY